MSDRQISVSYVDDDGREVVSIAVADEPLFDLTRREAADLLAQLAAHTRDIVDDLLIEQELGGES